MTNDWEFVLAVSLGFFDDIYIPRALLPSPSHDEPDPEDKWAYDLISTLEDSIQDRKSVV